MWRSRTGQSKSKNLLALPTPAFSQLIHTRPPPCHRRQKAAASRGTNPETDDGALIDEGPSPHLPSGPKKDFSLKEGETFAIKIPGGGGRKITSSSSSSSNTFGAGFGGAPLLPPPPSKKR